MMTVDRPLFVLVYGVRPKVNTASAPSSIEPISCVEPAAVNTPPTVSQPEAPMLPLETWPVERTEAVSVEPTRAVVAVRNVPVSDDTVAPVAVSVVADTDAATAVCAVNDPVTDAEPALKVVAVSDDDVAGPVDSVARLTVVALSDAAVMLVAVTDPADRTPVVTAAEVSVPEKTMALVLMLEVVIALVEIDALVTAPDALSEPAETVVTERPAVVTCDADRLVATTELIDAEALVIAPEALTKPDDSPVDDNVAAVSEPLVERLDTVAAPARRTVAVT